MSEHRFALLVGYKRSGTTFLRGYFATHPQIECRRAGYYLLESAEPKRETYLREFETVKAERVIDVCEHLALGHILHNAELWHARRFTPDAACGEDVTTIDPWLAARRVQRVTPEARILIILRNQVDWLRTHYRVFYDRLPPGQRRWCDFVSTPEGRLVLDGGRYDGVIEAYQDLFGAERVHVMLLESLRDHQVETLRRLCDFLGVDYVACDSATVPRNEGPRSGAVRLARLRDALAVVPPLQALARSLGRPVRHLIERAADGRDLFTGDERRLLAAFYAASNARTQRRTGQDLGRYGYPL